MSSPTRPCPTTSSTSRTTPTSKPSLLLRPPSAGQTVRPVLRPVLFQVQVQGRRGEAGPAERGRHALGQAPAQAHRRSVGVSVKPRITQMLWCPDSETHDEVFLFFSLNRQIPKMVKEISANKKQPDGKVLLFVCLPWCL